MMKKRVDFSFQFEIKIVLAFIIPFFCTVFTVLSQATQPARYELIHNTGDQGFTTITLKENGLALIREKKMDSGKRPWEIIILDSTLQQVWNTEVFLDSKLKLVGYEYTSGELFFLFRPSESDFNDLSLVRVYLFTHVIAYYNISPKLDFKLTHFIVVGNSAILAGYVSRQPAVLLYEMGSDHLKVVPGFFVSNVELLELKANHNSTFNALLVERGNRDKKRLLLKTFDESGAVLLEDNIDLDNDKMILGGTTSNLGHDELLLAGVWGSGSANTKQASGLFSVLVDPFSQQAVRYTEFGELEHVFDYLPPKRAAKLKSKQNRRREAKKPPNFRVNVHVVKLEETAKGFALLCELYQPTVSSNYPFYNPYYNPSYNPYYNSYYTPYSSGYMPYGYNPMMMNRYYNSPYNPYGAAGRNGDVTMLHSSLIIFDHTGKVREDFGFGFQELKLPALEQTSDFLSDGKFVQFFKNETTLYTATQWSDGSPPEQDTVKLQLRSSKDIVKNESNDQGGVRHWFGPYAYVWGYETIKNKTEQPGEPVRYVYYVNKVRLE